MTPETEAQLADVLDRELALATTLASLLDGERAALVGSAPDAVVERATEKTRLLARFEECETRRRELCAAAGIADGSGPLDRTAVPASIARRWDALLKLAAACRAANDVNGHIVHSRQHQVRQLIDVLRGDGPTTYGPQGRARSHAPRALAQA